MTTHHTQSAINQPREIIKGQNPPTLGGGTIRLTIPPRLSGAIGLVDAAIMQQLAWIESRDKSIEGRGVECSAKILHKEMGNSLDVKTVGNAVKRMIARGLIDEIRPFSGSTKAIWAVNVEACDEAARQFARDLIERSSEGASTTTEGAPISCTENGSPVVHRKRFASGAPKTVHAVNQKRVTPCTENGSRGEPKTGHQNDSHLYSDIVDKLDRLDTAPTTAQAPQPPSNNLESISNQNQAQSQSPEMASEQPRTAQDAQTPSVPMQHSLESDTAPTAAPANNFVIAGHKIYGLEIPAAHKSMLNDIYRRARNTLGDAIKNHTVEMWEAIIIGERNRVANPVVTQNTQNRPSRGVGVFSDANPYAARAYGRGLKSGESAPVLDAPPAPTSWDELMNEVVEGKKFSDHLSSRYPAYDGASGRPTLKTVLDGCREFYVREKRKIPLPSQVENWVSKDYQKHVVTYEESRGILTPALADKHGNQIQLIGNRQWTQADRYHWYNSHWWIQKTQSWSDSDPNDALVQLSQEEIDAARAAVFSGLKNIGKPPAQKLAPLPQPEIVAIDDKHKKAIRILVENSEDWHKQSGDPQGAFTVIGVDGAATFFPAGYRISEFDRRAALEGYQWHPLRGWVKIKPASALVSETGSSIGEMP